MNLMDRFLVKKRGALADADVLEGGDVPGEGDVGSKLKKVAKAYGEGQLTEDQKKKFYPKWEDHKDFVMKELMTIENRRGNAFVLSGAISDPATWKLTCAGCGSVRKPTR